MNNYLGMRSKNNLQCKFVTDIDFPPNINIPHFLLMFHLLFLHVVKDLAVRKGLFRIWKKFDLWDFIFCTANLKDLEKSYEG